MEDIKTGTIQITGLSDLVRKLEALPDRIAKNVAAGAIRAGAAVIRDEAKRLVPISTVAHQLGKKGQKSYALIQPGSLKKGIKVRLAPRNKRERPIEYWVYVSRKIWYWRFLEFGTSKMSSRPFMRPAFDKMRVQAVERVREYMAARIDKELLKAQS